jgi:hypothetical protein
MPSSGQRGYGDQMLIGYLLGAASDEEIERLDELSIADDDFAFRLRAVENDLVDSYVRGELEGATLERFEFFYLTSPERRGKVEFATSLNTLANRSRDTQMKHDSPTSMDSPARRAWLNAPFWSLAAAAALMLLTTGYLLRENRRLHQAFDQEQTRRVALEQRAQSLQRQLAGMNPSNGTFGNPSPPAGLLAFVLSPQTRGLAPIPPLKLPPGTGPVEFQLILELDDFARYRAALRDNAANRIVWRSEPLLSNPAKSGRAVSVVLPGGLLKPQNYSLELTGIPHTGAEESIGTYVFRIGPD